MKLPRRDFLRLAAGAAALAAESRTARAQSYPNRYVRLVIPFPPGGSADPVARVLAGRLSEMWGQQVVAENKGGAGGNIAAQTVAQSAPDGYTLFLGSAFLAINPFLYATMGYDPIDDLAPITLVCDFANVMVVPNASPAKSVGEFIAYARANRGKVTFGSSGTGAAPHMSGELFKRLANVEMTHVPYRGGGPALNDLIPGRLDVMFATIPSALPHVQSGTLRGLGVTSTARSPFAPELPTIAEAGVPGYEMSSWYALFAPARTPADIVRKIRDDALAVLALPAMKQRFSDIGATVATSTSTEVTTLIRSEMAKWGPIIQAASIKAE
jgi:tripartite-type tricarboxylate transporter receptor subunit TctC